MKTKKYIYCLAAMLISTACSNHEDLLPNDGQGNDDDIQFTATLQQAATITPRAESQGEVLHHTYDIRIRKVDKDATTDTQLFDVRSGNYGTLDMQKKGETSQTAMKWTDKTNDVDFYAWTVPTGVSIDNAATSGTVNFGCAEGEGNKPTTDMDCNTYDGKDVTPLEIFISAHQTANFNANPSVSLEFQHIVSKVSMNVVWWNSDDITEYITIKFPFINKVWEVEQTQSDSKSSFSVTKPADTPTEALSLDLGTLNLLAKNSKYRTFYLPPLTGGAYKFEKTGDFEITYNGETYYGSLAEISGKTEITSGQHLQVNIQLNPGGFAGGYATINDWGNKPSTTIQTNPYRGIYTTDDLNVLKTYLESTDTKELDKSLYIEENGKMIIRLYNDLTLAEDLYSLKLKDNMIFDGLGHTISVAKGQNLFGDIKSGNDATIEIRNVRLLGEGRLASSLENVTVYNCHANGAGNLVGTAKGTTGFNFCSAENSAAAITLMGAVNEDKVTVTNSFVASSATAFVSNTGGTVIAKNSFIISSSKNTYWSADATSENSAEFTIGNNVTATTVTIGGQTTKLIDLLNKGSEASGNTWVYVYGKSYPVMRIK